MKKCNIKGNSAFISSCHPRGFLSGISSLLKRQSGGDSQLRPLGMTPNLMGFTLIELLVVVLIIGILAAVALPQYQKAVRKSRYASLKPVVKAVKDAQELYFDEHGHYATESELDDLDIDIPEDITILLSQTSGHEYVSADHADLHNSYTMYLAHSENFANNIYCEADKNLDSAKELCVADGGKDTGMVNDGYRLYLLSGNSTGEFVTISRTPQNIFKTFMENYLKNCAGLSGYPMIACEFDLEILADVQDTCSEDGRCRIGDWDYWVNGGGSSAELRAYTDDGVYRTSNYASLSMTFRTFTTASSNPTINCYGRMCVDICGSNNCNMSLN